MFTGLENSFCVKTKYSASVLVETHYASLGTTVRYIAVLLNSYKWRSAVTVCSSFKINYSRHLNCINFSYVPLHE
jgi:hypothetical protein